MISLKCKSCGAEMAIDRSGEVFCDHCGNHSFFSDKDLAAYKSFRGNMLNYLRAMAERGEKSEEENNRLWEAAETLKLRTEDGTDINIEYLYSSDNNGVTMYMARTSVIFIFDKGKKNLVEKLDSNLSMLTFPAADMKNLNECFPRINGRFLLADGRYMLVIQRDNSFFPLSMFGALEPVHAAWIVSRMENIACVLAFSGISHNGISPDSVFINPVTHEAALLGNWWMAEALPEEPKGINEDLMDLRKTAKYAMGTFIGNAPKEFADFLNEKVKKEAFDDFADWDKVIEKGFGGRRFVKMNLEDAIF